jgi:hypothetical protein
MRLGVSAMRMVRWKRISLYVHAALLVDIPEETERGDLKSTKKAKKIDRLEFSIISRKKLSQA